MTDTNAFIKALLDAGANIIKNENNEMVARFLGSINTQTDKNNNEHLCVKDSTINLTARGYKIVKSEIIFSPL